MGTHHTSPPRNVTITSSSLDHVLDFAGPLGAVEICGACTVSLVNITTASETYQNGRTNVIGLFKGQLPGSRIDTLNYYGLRLACTASSDSIANLRTTPRSAAFPPAPGAAGEQQVAISNVTLLVRSAGRAGML